MNTAEQIEDQDAVALTGMQSGDSSGIHLLIRKYRAGALRFAQDTLGQHHHAKEIVQEAFLRVYEEREFHIDAPFKPRLLAIVLHVAIERAIRHA
jgi:DNA-directed RNA polymerase specialized sigma24 family protein